MDANSDRIYFTVNGKKCSVGHEVDSDVTILEYVRNYLDLRGTKYMCKEGGCGSCIVNITRRDHDGHRRTFSVNSCLVSITSCEGWDIKTIEGIGDRRQYHSIQKALAQYNGTQCGYCSPGWVMSMYSILEANDYQLTRYEIEDAFGSNTCRCTGYRPILDAFKSYAKDAPKPIPDIEELRLCKKNETCESKCDKTWCVLDKKDVEEKPKKIRLKDDRMWYRVFEIQDIFSVLESEGLDSYMLVNGNTGRGVSPIFAYPRVLIDISPVRALKTYLIDQNLVIGAGLPLNDVMVIFQMVADKYEQFSYLKKLYEHLNLVAHIPVRNIGSVGGNLMVKHRQQDFPSDVFLLLETIGATLTIVDKSNSFDVTPESFLRMDMSGKLITNVKLPPLSKNHLFVSFKIMPRNQNAPAQVNAAFLYKIDEYDWQIVQDARIVIGGLSARFIHASATEKYLRGTKLFTNETLQAALKVLEKEMIVDKIRGYLTPEYRKKCALGLFYKGLLNLIPEQKLKPRYRSGARDLKKTRPLSSGTEVYDTNPVIWPINEPMPKLDALIQCSGEAAYVNDIVSQPNEVYCAFSSTEVGRGEIESIDPSAALKLPGVLTFISAKDIPGENNFMSLNVEGALAPEEVLCERDIKHYNQPYGIVVAETEKIAQRAALLVRAKYKNVRQPVLTVREARADPARITLFLAYPARDRGADVHRVLKGTQDIYWQYPYHLETQSCVTKPTEDGMEVTSATQWPDMGHVAISRLLNIEQNRINLVIPRCGGAYGAKISRSTHVACACALVTHLTNRPCRFIMSIQANIREVGKRNPTMFEYEVAVNDSGEIQYFEYDSYTDNGYVVSEPIIFFGTPAVKNCYDNRRWQYKLFNATTDTPSNTYLRSPGALETIAMTETVMERVSYEIEKDPLEVRLRNLNPQYTDVAEVVQTLIEDSEYYKRKDEVEKYNKQNRWKKRGLRAAVMSWPCTTIMNYHVLLTVYHGDATVVIRHGGIEIGQGINTKVCQAVAYTLNIPVSKVRVKAYEVSTAPNSTATGGSLTTQSMCFGAIKCCQLLIDRLNTVRDTLTEPTWELLVQTAFTRGINLQTSYRVTANDLDPFRTAGAALAEVELDVLTGEHEVLRVDIVEDVGLSLNPEIDIGQVEGAFIFGMGYWTVEHQIVEERTGEIESDRTRYYHVPLAKDIPIDFRVKLRRNSFNPIGVLGAKTVAEAPTCLAVSVAFALREAITASREDTGYPRNQWFNVDGPYTLEANVLKADARLDEFLFY